MRLTAIKLAGFKSFVDPTHIPIVGQMVGVVGPNGCGKSNVIDAVRWVLGESQAKQLRGASMQDVIFNGSSTRKPVSRASVELVFDNSLGRAAGQWTQYAEISVKRVLNRDGDSSYYVNNQHVRRRDLTDIFLGTGLGTKTSYAIIEQGMISRIIEAKPDELRGFLEEAAGISKYKERRRETESRLKDTRDNLLRVDDIRRELTEQVARLQAQALVAQQYHTLQSDLKQAQQMLWLVKKRDAEAARERFSRQIDDTSNQIEAQSAQFRQTELQIEETRTAHYAATDALNAAQGDFYAASAEVSRLEQNLRHLADTRARLAAQIHQLTEQRDSLEKQYADMAASLAQWQQRLQDTNAALADAEIAFAESSDSLPEMESLLADTQTRVADLQRELTLSEQSHQIDETHHQHSVKTLQQLEARHTRLTHEHGGLPEPDRAALSVAEAELETITETLESLREQADMAQQQLPALEAQRQHLRTQLEEITRRQHQSEGQLAGLNQIQAHLDADTQLDGWLDQHALTSLPRLWQHIDVETGWETALEAVLRERINALAESGSNISSVINDIPPSRVSFYDPHAMPAAAIHSRLPLLLDKVRWKTGQGGALADWIGEVYVADNAAEALTLRVQLPANACLVCPEGHVFTRHTVSFHAEQSAVQGVLARQKEIERLTLATEESALQKEILAEQLAQSEDALRHAQQSLGVLRNQLNQTQQRQHQLQMDTMRVQQALERVTQRSAQITAELGEVEAQMEQERTEQQAASERLHEHRTQAGFVREHLEDARRARSDAENLLNQKREAQRSSERKLQEIRFTLQSCDSKINDLNNAMKVSSENKERLNTQLAQLDSEQTYIDESDQQAALQQAISERQTQEQALAARRNELESANAQLRTLEEARMRLEQGLTPLRNRMEELRLNDQESRLLEAQCREQLEVLQADEAALIASVEKGAKVSGLNAEITQLTSAIEGLGGVNLAALDELQHAQEREIYLTAQGDDLNQAIATLESAIQKIDGETRELLKTTFDTVNQSMSELFTTLFGGGQAQLILTGDELLDAGVQVFAQPPGKKNSSIHLLSGGEKALTALSLIFALFKLTPAPFCLLDEVDAPLDDSNTERYARLVKQMSEHVQFLFITHNRITMEAAHQLIGVTMQESGVSRTVAVDLELAASLAAA
ncbi:MAG: chromosome segregation protein SMC [Sulfuriferula sp.]